GRAAVSLAPPLVLHCAPLPAALASSRVHFAMRRPSPPALLPYTTLFRSHIERTEPEAVPRVMEPHALKVNERRHITFVQRFLPRSEEHTSELQSRFDLVCRLLLEKKNNENITSATSSARQRANGSQRHAS